MVCVLAYVLLAALLPISATAAGVRAGADVRAGLVCCVKNYGGEEREGETNTACKHRCDGTNDRDASFDDAIRDTTGNNCLHPTSGDSPCGPAKCIPQRVTGKKEYVKVAIEHFASHYTGLLEVGESAEESAPVGLHPLACKMQEYDAGGKWRWREVRRRSGFACCSGLRCRQPGKIELLVHGGAKQGNMLQLRLDAIFAKKDIRYGFCYP
jgi:hypothetical protein